MESGPMRRFASFDGRRGYGVFQFRERNGTQSLWRRTMKNDLCVALGDGLQRRCEPRAIVCEDHGRTEVLPHEGQRREFLYGQRICGGNRRVGNARVHRG